MINWNWLKRLSLLCATVIGALQASAQLKSNLKHYSTEDGLSHDRVLCMTKDSEGFMWFGTWDGINRFDGHNFIAYKGRPGDSSNLKNNKIRNIVEDKLGFLWVKTYDNEVYRFDKRTEKFLSVPQAVAPNRFKKVNIDKIVPVSNGDTWLLTNKDGLICSFGDRSTANPRLEQYSQNASGQFNICGNNINFLFEDSESRLWVGTTTGICCLIKSGSTYIKLNIAGKPFFGKQYSFTAITENKGSIYLGTNTGNLIVCNTAGNTVTKDVAGGNAINALYFSKNKVLYASTMQRGLAIINPTNYNVKFAGIAGNDTFYSLFEDRA
jgi:ligand-binding sensor domain-containing protein